MVAILHRSQSGGRFTLVPDRERFPGVANLVLNAHAPDAAKREALNYLSGILLEREALQSADDAGPAEREPRTMPPADAPGWTTPGMF